MKGWINSWQLQEMGKGGCDLTTLFSSVRSKWRSGSLVSLEDQGPEISTAWKHLQNRKESRDNLGWKRRLEAIQSTLLLKTGLTNSEVRRGLFSIKLWVSPGMGTPSLPQCSTLSGKKCFSLYLVPISLAEICGSLPLIFLLCKAQQSLAPKLTATR